MSPLLKIGTLPIEICLLLSKLILQGRLDTALNDLKFSSEEKIKIENNLFFFTDEYNNKSKLNLLVTKILIRYSHNLDTADKKFERILSQQGRDEIRQRIYRVIVYGVNNQLIHQEQHNTPDARESFTKAVAEKLINTGVTLEDIFYACINREMTSEEFLAVSSSRVIIRDYEHRWDSFKPTIQNPHESMKETQQLDLFAENTLIQYGLSVPLSNRGFKTLFLPTLCNNAQQNRKEVILEALKSTLQEYGISWLEISSEQKQNIALTIAKISSFTRDEITTAIAPILTGRQPALA